jgi:hypothetical protein
MHDSLTVIETCERILHHFFNAQAITNSDKVIMNEMK